jgi:hypothetical protein
METLLNGPVEHHPLVLLAVALVMQWLAAYLGNYLSWAITLESGERLPTSPSAKTLTTYSPLRWRCSR